MPRGLRRGHRDLGHKGAGRPLYRPWRAAAGASGQGKGEGESARATSPGATPPPGPLRAPGRGPTARLRGSRGGCSAEAAGRTLSRGCRPLARPALPHRLHAPRLGSGARPTAESSAAAESRAAAGGVRPLPSPRQTEGLAEGRGRRPRRLGFAPPRACRTGSRRLRADSPPAARCRLHSAPR